MVKTGWKTWWNTKCAFWKLCVLNKRERIVFVDLYFQRITPREFQEYESDLTQTNNQKQGHVGQRCVWFSSLDHSFIIVVVFVIWIIQICPSFPNIAQAYSDLPGPFCMPGLARTFLYARTCPDFPVCPDLLGLSCISGLSGTFLYARTCPDLPRLEN